MKYELTTNFIKYADRKLYQIKALKDFGDVYVMILKFIKSLMHYFQNTIVDDGEPTIHKNAATLPVDIMLEQNNVSSKTESNNNN